MKALVEAGFPCILYAPEGRAYPSMLELALKIKERGGEMVIVSRDRGIAAEFADDVRVLSEGRIVDS